MTCPRCGSEDIDERRARPKYQYKKNTPPELPYPWTHLQLAHGGTILLTGNAGSGKTTLACKLNPTRYCSSEQQIEMVYDAWHRVVGQHNLLATVPRFSTVSTWEELDEDLIGLTEDDFVVVDSVTQLTTQWDSIRIIRQTMGRIQVSGARGLFIAQYTKEGDMYGPNQLRHLVDVLAEIPDDSTGMRRLAIGKNRFGTSFSQYFALDNAGVIPQDFPFCYSIEGSAGNYHLHMYPTSGAKLAGIFDDLAQSGVHVMKSASAAVRCNLYTNGYAQPPDITARRNFAERHELDWITPERAVELIQHHHEEALNNGTT